MVLLLLSLQITSVEVGPIIDGKIEPLWSKAEPLSGFIQEVPDPGEAVSESTRVYLLLDKENLYAAFECKSNDAEPTVKISDWDHAYGDEVSLFIDTFGDKRTCYRFTVSSAGTQEDAIISHGGRSFDFSFDGIWDAATSVQEDEWSCEMKIPFKTIRYNRGKWGLQLSRKIEEKRETVYFKEVNEMKGLRISDFEPITGINPEMKGRFLEFYPVGILRHELDNSGDAGLDVSWDPSPNTSLDFTVNPDYAQIEADPFQVNLTQYALYLSEKRPFFLESRESFNLQSSDSRRGRQFKIGPGPLKLFYSRNIGKIVNDTIKIPIRAGTKVTTRGKGFEGGVLYANTGKGGDEPSANYLVGRFLKQLPFGLNFGFSYSGKYTHDYNAQIASLDGSQDFGDNNIMYQLAVADSTGKTGLAEYFEWKKMSENLLAAFSFYNVDEDFRGNEIGFINLRGLSINSLVGPVFYPNKKGIRMCSIAIAGGISKEPWVEDYSYVIAPVGLLNFRNGWNINTNANIGKVYSDSSYSKEKGSDISYILRGISLFLNSSHSGIFGLSFMSNFSYSYNYLASHLGYQLSSGSFFRFQPTPNFFLGSSVNLTGFWKEGTNTEELFSFENLEDLYITTSPTAEYHFSPSLSIEFRTDFTYLWSEKELIQTRINPLIKWMISPKSYLYLVYFKEIGEAEGFFEEPGNSVIKLRYLIYI